VMPQKLFYCTWQHEEKWRAAQLCDVSFQSILKGRGGGVRMAGNLLCSADVRKRNPEYTYPIVPSPPHTRILYFSIFLNTYSLTKKMIRLNLALTKSRCTFSDVLRSTQRSMFKNYAYFTMKFFPTVY
jgi:hypothetical protein